MKILQMADAIRYRTMTTEELRETFLIDDLFRPGQIGLRYVDLDRTVIGSAGPTGEPLKLPTDDSLKATYFTERRELGVLNIGGAGAVTVNGAQFELKKLDALSHSQPNDTNRLDKVEAFCGQWVAKAFRRPLSDDQKRLFVSAQFKSARKTEDAVKRIKHGNETAG